MTRAPLQTHAYPVASCAECGLESAGRCPTCRRSLCMDHFPLEEHQPCAQRLITHRAEYVCYVCGIPVRPQQWSTNAFAHYIDSCKCKGCGRYICDDPHTIRSEETIELVRDGLRSHRYHVMQRYCSVCSPLHRFGGIRGAATLVVALTVAATIVAFFLLR